MSYTTSFPPPSGIFAPGSREEAVRAMAALGDALAIRVDRIRTDPFALLPLSQLAVERPDAWREAFVGIREDYQWDLLTAFRQVVGNPLVTPLIQPLAESPAELPNVSLQAMVADLAERDWHLTRQWLDHHAGRLRYLERRSGGITSDETARAGQHALERLIEMETGIALLRQREADWAYLIGNEANQPLVVRLHRWERAWLEEEVAQAAATTADPRGREAERAMRDRLRELTEHTRTERRDAETAHQAAQEQAATLRAEIEDLRRRTASVQAEIAALENAAPNEAVVAREAEIRLAARRHEIEDLRRAAQSEDATRALALLDQIYALLPPDGAEEGFVQVRPNGR